MRNSKLVQILKKLSVGELQDFGDFVRSPFFNKNKKCAALCDLLLPYGPDFSNPKMDAPGFTKGVYSNQRSLNTVLEKMLRLLEQYLLQQEFGQEEELQKYFLLEGLRKLDEQKHYNLVRKRAVKKLSEKKEHNTVFYGAYLFEISQLEMLYHQKTSQESKALQLEKTIRAFDKYLLSKHLWLDNTVLSTRKIGSAATRVATEEIVANSEIFNQLANREPYRDQPLIQLRLLMNNLLKYNQDENFEELFRALKSKYQLISHSDNQHLYKFMVNYCIAKIIAGNQSYYRQLLDVYIFTMEIGILIEDGHLDPLNMKNIIVTSVKAGEVDLARTLLNKYLSSIHHKYRELTAAYCQGYLHFQKKEYNDASDLLQQCTNMRSLFELDAQSILYKIYYETNEDWAFDIPVQSFMSKLSRHGNKRPQYIIKGYINFFRILKQIYQKKRSANYKKTIGDIRKKMDDMKHISDKQWLLEKSEELGLDS